MPKCYSDQERSYIRERLKAEAAKCMARYGIRRTTVDEIVKRVKIPKGTFYLFYASKEQLLFEVILEKHDSLEQELFQTLGSISPAHLTAAQLTELLLSFFQKASEMPLLKVLNSDGIELLARKLPPDVLEEHFGHDNDMIEKVMAILPVRPGLQPEALSAAFRAIYLTTLHQEELGEQYYEGALRYLIHGLVLQILPPAYQ